MGTELLNLRVLSPFFPNALKTLEVVIPEPLVMRDPVPHRTEPREDEAIATMTAAT